MNFESITKIITKKPKDCPRRPVNKILVFCLHGLKIQMSDADSVHSETNKNEPTIGVSPNRFNRGHSNYENRRIVEKEIQMGTDTAKAAMFFQTAICSLDSMPMAKDTDMESMPSNHPEPALG